MNEHLRNTPRATRKFLPLARSRSNKLGRYAGAGFAMPSRNPTTPLEASGTKTNSVTVEIGTRFLEQFSEHLYSSPQKAFEELISNGWDAGANCVDVRISEDLSAPGATMCVLDNGASMNEDGIRTLWKISFSPKIATPEQYGRPVIGKFGIGKLATYVLANKLTYICCAADGIIRRVTMDYGGIDRHKEADPNRLLSQIPLDLYKLTEKDLERALRSIDNGPAALKLIKEGIPKPPVGSVEDEFCAPPSPFKPPHSGTWTLVVLSDLKQTGRELKIGILRRMLRAALPLGAEMAITLNGQVLESSKMEAEPSQDWVISPDLGIDHIEIDSEDSSGKENTKLKILITGESSPDPYIWLPDIGRVTGRVKLFTDPISGGKSDERGSSNGFHVNVLGRLVNQQDPTFGEDNLSHAAWARFRMTVRADGLNRFLSTNREQFQERRDLTIFRAFLRRAFNKARTQYDDDANIGIPDGGDVLVQSLGVLSLTPLRNVVSEALRGHPPLPGLFDETGVQDRQEKRRSWRENTAENISAALREVKYEKGNDDTLAKFRIADNTLIVNSNHPFALEHSGSKAEKDLVRTVAMVNLLSDMFAIDIGIDPRLLESVRAYRDRLMRFKALQRRQSGAHIASLLLHFQNDSSGNNWKRLESVVSDALRYLGFQVQDIAKSGEPEGIASAFPVPTRANPTDDNPHPPLYRFSFDAKTSRYDAVKTGNMGIDGVVEHRDRYKADHALVIAPGYTGSAVVTRCTEQRITPATARDLGRLLEYTVEYGAIPLTWLREMLQIYDPTEVAKWVAGLEARLKSARVLTIDVFVEALRQLEGKVPDALPAEMIAFTCRETLGVKAVRSTHVQAVAQGLSILVPDLVGIDGDKIVVNASPNRVAEAIATQLEKLRSDPAPGST